MNTDLWTSSTPAPRSHIQQRRLSGIMSEGVAVSGGVDRLWLTLSVGDDCRCCWRRQRTELASLSACHRNTTEQCPSRQKPHHDLYLNVSKTLQGYFQGWHFGEKRDRRCLRKGHAHRLSEESKDERKGDGRCLRNGHAYRPSEESKDERKEQGTKKTDCLTQAGPKASWRNNERSCLG